MENTFERAIVEDPENSDLYAVYGDWLHERGDARGEFIQVQLRLEDEGLSEQERTLLSEREAALLQQSQHLWVPANVHEYDDYELVFKRGFLVELHGPMFSDQELAELIAFPHLRALSIHEECESESGFAALAQLPLLRELRLPVISDEVLLHVAKQTGLESLSFWGPVTNAGLGHLRGLPALKELSYLYFPAHSHSEPITDEGLKHLSHHRSLRSLGLRLKELRLTDNGFAHLKDLHALEELALQPSKLTAIGLAHLGSLSRLTRLGLCKSVLANEDLHHLARLADLNALDLSFSNLNDVGLQHVAAIPKLRFLAISTTQVSVSGLSTLAQCTSLESLELPVDFGLQHLQGLTNLKHLALAGLRVPIESLAPLASLPGLQSLRLHYTGVTSAALADLAALPALRSANLCGTPITDDGLAALRPLALAELNVADTKVSDASLAMLCDMRSLRLLNVSDTAITDQGFATLEEALPHCRIITDQDEVWESSAAINKF